MADEIVTLDGIPEIADPNIRAVAKRALLVCQRAALKAAAHDTWPSDYKMPGGDPLEGLFLNRLQSLPQPKRDAAKARSIGFLRQPKEVQRGVYGDIADSDLSTAEPISERANRSFPAQLKFPKSHLDTLKHLRGDIIRPGGIGGGVVPQQTTDKLELRLYRVRCIDETGDGWGGEWGKDEIDLGGVGVDETGDTHKVAAYRVGNFDDGNVVNYSPPRRFTMFDLREGTAWPKSYFVTLALAEIDMGGIADYLNRLVDKVRTEVITALTTAIGTAIGTSGGVVGMVIGAAVGWCVGKAIEWLKAWWGDDIFNPQTVSVNIPSFNARWSGATNSSPRSVNFKGHDGEYEIVYDWRVYS